MRIVGFKGDFPLNDRLYGRAQSRTNFPSSRIVGVPTDVRAVTDLFKSDLVIDATGEEPVSEMLNERRIVQGTTTPLMHAWILGNGMAPCSRRFHHQLFVRFPRMFR